MDDEEQRGKNNKKNRQFGISVAALLILYGLLKLLGILPEEW